MNQLTKREQIAAAAMQALIGQTAGSKSFPSVYAKNIAIAALQYADALLEVLSKDSFVKEEDTHGE